VAEGWEGGGEVGEEPGGDVGLASHQEYSEVLEGFAVFGHFAPRLEDSLVDSGA
jgi:hypothetical protein